MCVCAFVESLINFLVVDVSESMSYPNKRCEFCGDLVTNGNYRRHLRRWHPDESVGEETFSRSSSRESTPSSDSRRLITEQSCRSLSADNIRDAVLCMLRRQDGTNEPMMSNYLSYYLSDIPVNMHMPIIVATFTAAQKVAATHGDTLLPGDDERTTWARRSLTRWTHGLSGVEKRFPCDIESSDRASSGATPDCLSRPLDEEDGDRSNESLVPEPCRGKNGDLHDKSEDSSMKAKPTPSPVPKSINGDDGDHSEKVGASSTVLNTAPARPSTSQKPFDEPNGDRSDGSIVPKPSGGRNDVLTVESGASLTEKVVVIEHSDVEPDNDGKCPTRHSNVFDSHKLPVPLESTFAQADVKAVLDKAVSNSSTTSSLFDKGPNEVFVRRADPDIDLLLCHETSVPPSMPRSFYEMFVDGDDRMMQSDLLRPVSIVLTPLTTPNADRFNTEEDDTPTDIILHPSPHSSIEGDSASADIRSGIKQGKLKGIKIKRKVHGDQAKDKENEPLIVEKSVRTSPCSSQPAVPGNTASQSKAATTAKPDQPGQLDDVRRLKSAVSKGFRIPMKPREQNEPKSGRHARSPAGRDPFGRNRHHDGFQKSTYRQRVDSHRGWHPARPYDRPTEDRWPPRPHDRSAEDRRQSHPREHLSDDHRPRLTPQQLQWLQRMLSGWNF